VSVEMRSSPGHSQLVTRSSRPKIGIAGIKVATIAHPIATLNLLIICQRKFFIVALIYCALGIAGTMQVKPRGSARPTKGWAFRGPGR
jgi:hypothetical protein